MSRISTLILAAVLAGATANAQTLTALSDDGATNYELRPVFQPTPDNGFAAFNLRVSGAGEDQAVTIEGTSGFNTYYGNRRQFETVGAATVSNARSWQPVLLQSTVPDENRSGSYSGSSIPLSLIAQHRGMSVYFGSTGSHSSGEVRNRSSSAISNEVVKLSENKLKDRHITFDSSELPADWRAFSGLDSISFTGIEWRKLDLATRRALLDYVLLGGNLRVVTPTPGTDLGLTMLPAGKNKVTHGLGTVEISNKPAPSGSQKNAFLQSSNAKPSIGSEIAEDKKPGALTLLGVLALGILIGPVNLFVLTRGRRHRLFFTIPAIAIGASLVFVAAIFIEDGLGGSGERIVIVSLSPDSASAAVLQQQASRCGALLGTSFTTPDPALIISSSAIKSTQDRKSTGNITLRTDSKSFTGDWFKSRQKQVFTLGTVIATRSRLELSEISTPEADTCEVTNTTGSKLDSMIYIDAAGNAYRSTNETEPGGKATLFKCTVGDAISIVSKAAQGKLDRSSLANLQDAAKAGGQIIAIANEAPDLCIDTLESIDWETSSAIIIQPVIN